MTKPTKKKNLRASAPPCETKIAEGKTLVPKLRFPEFLGNAPWKEVPIKSILAVRDYRRVPSKDVPLYSLTIESGITEKTDRYNREFLVRDSGNKKYKLVEPNDIVYNPSNLRWGAINYSKLTHSVVVSPIYEVLSLVDSSENLLEFIACSVMRDEQIARFITKGQGTLVERVAVKIDAFLSTELPVPPSRFEQRKIAECLSSVDDLIAAQARKVDALKTHKNGLMQQLFPREGETQPRLRFPEFQNAGDWVPDSLENLCTAKISYGIVQAGPDVPNGMPYIKSADLNAELCLASLSRTSEAIALKYQRSEVVPGDIVFSLRGNIGVSQIVPQGIPVANLTQGTARIRTEGPPEFYLHSLRTQPVYNRILAVGKGSTFQEISLEALRKIHVFRPGLPEQQRIAACLSSLDDLITAEGQKLEVLKTHKRGLMQQLFPSAEAPGEAA